jgi:hypothetical protein
MATKDSARNPICEKFQSKNGFLSLPAKENVAQKIRIIAATKRLKIYEVIEMVTRAKFPEFFDL